MKLLRPARTLRPAATLGFLLTVAIVISACADNPDGGAGAAFASPTSRSSEPTDSGETAEPKLAATVRLRDEEGYQADMTVRYSSSPGGADATNDKPGETTLFVPIAGEVTFANATEGGRTISLMNGQVVTLFEIYRNGRAVCRHSEEVIPSFDMLDVHVTSPTRGLYCLVPFATAILGNYPDIDSTLAAGESATYPLVRARKWTPGGPDAQQFPGVREELSQGLLDDMSAGADYYAVGLDTRLTSGSLGSPYFYEFAKCTRGISSRFDIVLSEPAGLACRPPQPLY